MLLTIDIGNTNIKFGIYEGPKLVAQWRIATNADRMPDEFGIQLLSLLQHGGYSPAQLDGACMTSVVPVLTPRLVQACRQYLNLDVLVIDSTVKSGITIKYDDPRALGADRLTNAVAAKTLYGCPVCVVGLGTATTFDAVDRDGNFLGGAIAPGLNLGAEALVLRTAKLPRIEIKRPPSVIGKNTTHAIQSGLLLGHVAMVEGLLERIRKELGADMKVVATGGLAEIIMGETSVVDIYAPSLTLDGLRILWEMNR